MKWNYIEANFHINGMKFEAIAISCYVVSLKIKLGLLIKLHVFAEIFFNPSQWPVGALIARIVLKYIEMKWE